ncbi:MAG: hypothetical protein RJA07_2475 [Bacteroidota bacterium]|jgi:TrmH family RNA methyltransferase
MNISKNQISFLKSLTDKKFRLKYESFVAEGNKICEEVLNSNWEIEQVYATIFFIERYNFKYDKSKIHIVTKNEIERISNLFSPTEVIVIAKIPTPTLPQFDTTKWSLALDGIQDPGNFGTIIRTADWFGISEIFASHDCADFYNSKTIQATMGSFLRVKVHYCNLNELIQQNHFKTIAGAVMNGKNIFTETISTSGLMILGNEGRGISETILPLINQPLTIPSKGNAESLNVAVAAGIICSQIT